MKNLILKAMTEQLLPMWTVKVRFMTVNLLWVGGVSKSYLGCRWSQPTLGSICSVSVLYQSTLAQPKNLWADCSMLIGS